MRSLFLILTLSFAAVAQPTADIVHRFSAEMNRPTDVVVLDDGRICVADGVNGRVVVFKQDGSFKELRFSEMKRPLGLAADINGGLLITDTEADIILILNKHLALKSVLPLAQEIDATDVLPIDDELLWVVDNDGHQILVMNRRGSTRSTIGKKGSAGPTFSFPSTISLGKENRIFICDVLNGRIQLFESDGSYRGQIADWGISPGSFYRPKGIATNKAGAFVVTDSFTGTIQYFRNQSASGSVIMSKSTNPLRLKNPLGVDWGEDGLLWIVESGSGDVLGVRLK